MVSGTVTVVGSANMDLVFRCSRLPAPGETVLGGRFETAPGGKGANQAAAIGRLGGAVEFVGRVGDDDFGTVLRESLTRCGVGTAHLSKTSAEPTGVAIVMVAADGENAIVVAPGANGTLSRNDVANALATTRTGVVLAQLEVPMEAVEACGEASVLVLNPAPAVPLSESFLRRVAVITPNELETEALTGIRPTDPESSGRAAAALHAKGVPTVVLTLGGRGCYVSDGRHGEMIEAFPVRPVDTTAAGDAFSGALTHFLAAGRDIWNAAGLAGKVAALSTTKAGAQASMPSRDELRAVAGDLL